MPTLSKRIKKLSEKVDASKTYSFAECCELIKECATAKFDETIELAFLLGSPSASTALISWTSATSSTNVPRTNRVS